MRLTDRDMDFLMDLHQVKYLNSKRICRLYGNYKKCMSRLKYMVDSGYVSVIYKLTTGENVYAITKKACRLLGADTININVVDKLNHYFACADFYFSIKNVANDIEFEVQYSFKHNGEKNIFRPDLLINMDRWLFVEIDLCNRRFEKKLMTWEAFYASGEFEKYFAKFPPIVIVSTNPDKIRTFIESSKKINLNYVFKAYREIKEWSYSYEK